MLGKEHERRIELLTGFDQSRKTHILKFCTNINTRKGLCNFKQACEATISQGKYPADDKGDEVDLTNLSINENNPQFWQVAAREITEQLRNVLQRNNINRSRIEHLSIFALAPIPLLIHFGKEIGDIISADVYQKQRDTDSWVWQDNQDLGFDYNVSEPSHENGGKIVILNLSLSGTIHQDEINKVMRKEDYPTYKITIANPNRDFLKSKEQLELFKQEYLRLLAVIRERHGSDCEIHLFPAIPVSIAVECGRILLPKSDPPLVVYDNNNKGGGFKYALVVNKT